MDYNLSKCLPRAHCLQFWREQYIYRTDNCFLFKNIYEYLKKSVGSTSNQYFNARYKMNVAAQGAFWCYLKKHTLHFFCVYNFLFFVWIYFVTTNHHLDPSLIAVYSSRLSLLSSKKYDLLLLCLCIDLCMAPLWCPMSFCLCPQDVRLGSFLCGSVGGGHLCRPLAKWTRRCHNWAPMYCSLRSDCRAVLCPAVSVVKLFVIAHQNCLSSRLSVQDHSEPIQASTINRTATEAGVPRAEATCDSGNCKSKRDTAADHLQT